jgi:hypothetical protein
MVPRSKHVRRLSKTAKREILRRFAGRCAFCLAEADAGAHGSFPPRTMRPDMAHFTAWSRGGSTTAENVVPLCLDHHEKFDKQQQTGRAALMLSDLLAGSRQVSRSTLREIHGEIRRISAEMTFHDMRRKIWRIKAKQRIGPSLLVEEADILCKIGQSSDCCEGRRRKRGPALSKLSVQPPSDTPAGRRAQTRTSSACPSSSDPHEASEPFADITRGRPGRADPHVR